MTPITDPEGYSLLRVVFAFAVVIGLLSLMGFGLKYMAARGIQFSKPNGRPRRLQVVETLPLDVRRRLVIVRCDEKEHLLLLGVDQDTVVDREIPNSKA